MQHIISLYKIMRNKRHHSIIEESASFDLYWNIIDLKGEWVKREESYVCDYIQNCFKLAVKIQVSLRLVLTHEIFPFTKLCKTGHITWLTVHMPVCKYAVMVWIWFGYPQRFICWRCGCRVVPLGNGVRTFGKEVLRSKGRMLFDVIRVFLLGS